MPRLLLIPVIIALAGILIYLVLPRKKQAEQQESLTKRESESIVKRQALVAKVDKFIVEADYNSESVPFSLIQAREALRVAEAPDHIGIAVLHLEKEWNQLNNKNGK